MDVHGCASTCLAKLLLGQAGAQHQKSFVSARASIPPSCQWCANVLRITKPVRRRASM